MVSTYFNEFDRFPAAWLRALYPGAEVDERSIADVGADELLGRERCHFFAGIGGWEYALELAGWPAGVPVWTGSCPCQPFSAAGKGLGTADPRHLWPEFRRLIALCRPPVVFGEQVASKAGRLWLAGVRADMEEMGYAFGAADLCAAGVGAPHIRQRLYWVAYAAGERRVGERLLLRTQEGRRDEGEVLEAARSSGPDSGLADRYLSRSQGAGCGTSGARWAELGPCGEGEDERLGHADEQGPQGRRKHPGEHADQRPAWASGVYLDCTDGKARRVEPGVCPLAHGVSGRVGQLRGYGNAIVPQVAAQFVSAFMEAVHA